MIIVPTSLPRKGTIEYFHFSVLQCTLYDHVDLLLLITDFREGLM